jgi:hypothetical protein
LSTKEEMIEALKSNCGGACLTDPDNCTCFEAPTQELLDECNMDLDDWAIFDTKEECPHYDATAWILSQEKDDTDTDFFKKSFFEEILKKEGFTGRS